MYNVSFPALGWEFKINPIAFSIGGLNIRWYGILIAAGLLLAVVYAYFSAQRYNVDRNKLFDCVLVGLVAGVIGARLYYVLFRLDLYTDNPWKIFMISEGGLAIYGGIIFGLVGGAVMAKIKKAKILPMLDIAVMGFLIGQGLGRWGNFFNQEAYGTTTNLPWGMMSEGTELSVVHPCFLYESLWCLLGFVVLHFWSRKYQKYAGQVFYLYLAWYGFERMIVEGLRTDSLYLPFGGLRVSQVLSAALFIVGIVLLIINRNKEDSFYDDYRRKKGIGSGKRAGSRRNKKAKS